MKERDIQKEKIELRVPLPSANNSDGVEINTNRTTKASPKSQNEKA